ncbi:MAG: hypothetical protein GTO22_22075 [Gemmatimonadales bacterium]|nr:hypothetical protein [Gemmatimonadales bacterium]
MDYLVDMNVVTREGADRARGKYRYYIPFFREMFDQLEHGGAARPRSFVAMFNPIRRIRESGRRILNPLENILKQLYRDERLAHRAMIARALKTISEIPGAGRFVERLPAPPEGHRARVGDVLKKVLGLNDEQLRQLGIHPDDGFVLWTKGEYHDPTIIPLVEGGERVWYKIHDEQMVRDLQNLDPVQFGALTRFFSGFKTAFRAATVLFPAFPPRNIIRDQWSRAILSVHGTKYLPGKLGEWVGPMPFEGFVNGFLSMIRRDEDWLRMHVGGGGMVGVYQSMTRTNLRREATRLTRGPITNVVKHPLDLLWAIGDASENATRLSEMKLTWKKLGIGEPGHRQRLEEVMAGTLHGREVSTDFTLQGRWAAVRWLAQTTAFWKPGMLGFERMVREFVNHPVRATFRSVLKITFPTVALFYWNKDDPEYWDLPQWQRDYFWLVKVPNLFRKFVRPFASTEETPFGGELLLPATARGEQVWLRFPKPFELGILFGAIPERILGWAHDDDPKALHEALGETLGRGVLGSMVPIPTIAAPLIENLANRTFFFGTQVEPERLKDKPVEERYTEQTSELARHLSRWMNKLPYLPDMSPMQWENIIYGYGSSLGYTVGEQLDPALRLVTGREPSPKITGQPADIPVFGVFTGRWPTPANEPSRRFWESFRKNDQIYEQLRDYENAGQVEKATAYAEEHIDELTTYREQAPIAEQLRQLGRLRADFRYGPGLTAAERSEGIKLANLVGRDLAAAGIAWPHFTPDSAQMENRITRIKELAEKVNEAQQKQTEVEREATAERRERFQAALQKR